MIDITTITQLHHEMVVSWHLREVHNPYSEFLAAVCEQHKFNFLLWHEEDIARSPDVTDREISKVKRSIDRFNQQRNDWIERLDDYLLKVLSDTGVVSSSPSKLNTETPGSVIDRLSILSLRIYHMEEQAQRGDAGDAHREKAVEKLRVMRQQHADLANSLQELVDDIEHGRKQLKVYHQFKMYNDPTLNPYLYKSSKRQAG